MESVRSTLFVMVVCLLALRSEVTLGQRVAPGVPPQHYNQHDPNQQFQHQQQQFQQQQQFGQGHPPPPPSPQQHQQQFVQQPPPPGVAPQQYQQQQHIPHQQVPVQHQGHGAPPPQQQQHQQIASGHGHEHGQAPFSGHGQPLLDTSNIGKERQHIQEHMDVPIDTSQMSEQELQFHYFKMHDADNNNKLDGCELVKSLIHWHDASNHDHRGGTPVPEPKVFSDEELINMIDPILKNDDRNGDGFIDYAEFQKAQAQAATKAQEQKTH